MKIGYTLFQFILLFLTISTQAEVCPNDFTSEEEMIKFVEQGRDGDGRDIRIERLNFASEEGREDRLIGTDCGNAGCDYFVFLQYKPKLFRYAGHGFFHKDAFKVFRNTQPNVFEILAYWRLGISEGKLIRYRSAGCRTFEQVAVLEGSSEKLFEFVKKDPISPPR